MKKILLIALPLLLIVGCSKEPVAGPTLIDIDGNSYKTVKIGNKIWMAENLKVTHYRNGDEIPTGHSNDDWYDLSTGAYAVWGNNKSNVDAYGYLYNWNAVNDSRNIAPEGWHVPTDDEYKEMEMYLGMSQKEAYTTSWRGENEGSKLASRADLWKDDPGPGPLEKDSKFGTSGFNALPGGGRDNTSGIFHDMGNFGYFWTSNQHTSPHYGDGDAWHREVFHWKSSIYRGWSNKGNGYSVRCVMD